MSEHHAARPRCDSGSAGLGATGPEYWRSLEELAEHRGFPGVPAPRVPGAGVGVHRSGRPAAVPPADGRVAGAGRRERLHQAAGRERSCPTCARPRRSCPGRPLFFATAITLGGYATGVLVESHEGRPTKIEGNPEHPASLGATDLFAQAADPGPLRSGSLADADPVRATSARGAPSSARCAAVVEAEARRAGRGPAHPDRDGDLADARRARLRSFLAEFPAARWHQYEPAGRDNVRAGAHDWRSAAVVDTRYAFDKARVVVSLDADFLGAMPGVGAVHPRLRRRAGACAATARRHEPPLRGRERADQHRREGRSSAARCGRRDRGVRARRSRPPLGVPGAPAAPVGARAAQKWLDAAAARSAREPGRVASSSAGDEQPPRCMRSRTRSTSALGNTGVTVLSHRPGRASPGRPAAVAAASWSAT